MVILQAIILGIVEGLTEFLPISSTGHLIVVEHAIGYKDAAEIFTVTVQIGAIAAVAWFYRSDLWFRFRGLLKHDRFAQKFWLNLAIACAPAALAAVILEKTLEKYAVPLTVALALIIGGVILWLVEQYHTPPRPKEQAQIDKITHKQALQVGLFQVVSLIPGTSRSASTIIGGLLSGMDRVTATAFSFYVGLPLLLLASAYKLLKNHAQVSAIPGGVTAIVFGTIAAFISALFVVGWLLRYVARHDFKIFAYYRVALGVLIIILLLTGILANSL